MLKAIMRAVRVHKFGGPEVLQVENIPIPKVQDGQVLIKVLATGVNPVETYIRAGTHLIKPELPYTPGGDGAGIVEAVGSGVNNLKVGERVYTVFATGTYAEYAIVPQSRAFPLPQKLSFEQGAALGVPYYTAYHAIFSKAKSKPGESILIHGASGGVGIAGIQLAKAHGLTVYATVGTKEGADLVKSVGADHVFNHREKDYVESINKTTGGKGVDVVIEMLANVNLLTDISHLTARNGRIVIVGSRGSISEFNPRSIMAKEITIVGCALATATDSDIHIMSEAIKAGIEKGQIKPVIDKEYKLEDVAQCHNDIINSPGAKGKLIIKAAP